MGTKIKLKLKLSKSLKKHDRIQDIIKQCVESIKSLNCYEGERLHQNLTLSVMKSIQKACKYVDGEIDKDEMVKTILKEVYSLTDEELLIIDQQMMDIIDNQELVSGFFLKIMIRLLKLARRQLQ